MKLSSLEGLLQATKLTASGRLQEATSLIQQALHQDGAPGFGAPGSGAPGSGAPGFGAGAGSGPVIDGVAELVSPANGAMSGKTASQPHAAAANKPGQGQFLSAKFGNAAGSRSYRLYVPGSYQGQAMPLIVMLHGCTQSPEDFAAGTRMNEAAEEHGFLVAYPAQTQAANHSKCWNWFNAEEQRRGQGEPSLIAGITLDVMAHYTVDAKRVYVAGLSAGGAAAAIMGTTYPELFAAIGVHSGLACGAASDMMSAFSAMNQGQSGTTLASGALPVPAIVFHGDQDKTVNQRNGDAVIAQLMPAGRLQANRTKGQVAGGHGYSRTRFTDAKGQTVHEQWLIHGAGHAWAGGSGAGSYTDPKGPDATAEMVRFFLEHPHS